MDTAVGVVIPKCKAYTKYHLCCLHSSWEMNLNNMVEARVDANVDGQMDEWMENRIPILHHAKSRRNKHVWII